MSNIDKEWLQQKIADMEEHRDLFPGDLDDNHANVLAALRIALASLEAEPVAEVCEGFSLRYIGHGPAPKSGVHIGDRLYIAPPAPVSVPDEDLLHMAASAIDDLLSNKDRSGAGVWADIPAKLRRAAMLQGADPVQAWIPCSERMPDTMISVLVTGDWFRHAVSFWDGASWCDLDFEPPVTHWMPLPAAPQQEVMP